LKWEIVEAAGYNYGSQLRFNASVTGAPSLGNYGVSAARGLDAELSRRRGIIMIRFRCSLNCVRAIGI
jgi:hypothetical protein